MCKKRYVKNPIVIEAYQTDTEILVNTLEGVLHANPGDYIVTGPFGEQYPIRRDIFISTYSLAI